MSLNFRENGDFNNYVKNIFSNDPRGQLGIKGVWHGNTFAKFVKICDTKISQYTNIFQPPPPSLAGQTLPA